MTMANLFPYFAAILLLLNFSGVPKTASETKVVVAKPVHTIEETEDGMNNDNYHGQILMVNR